MWVRVLPGDPTCYNEPLVLLRGHRAFTHIAADGRGPDPPKIGWVGSTPIGGSRQRSASIDGDAIPW